MKRILVILLALSVCTFSACTDSADKDGGSQSDTSGKKDDNIAEADVPAAVVSAFKTKYPTATAVEWETAKENDQPTFKAKWKEGDVKMKAEFAQDGTFVKEEKD